MTATPMIKSFAPMPFEVKAIDEQGRRIKGLAAAWSLDLGDDVIHKGAFAKTLDYWKRSNRVIPLTDGHPPMNGSVGNVVGKMETGVETDEGLLAEFSVLENDPQADAVYKRAKAGMINGLSITYSPVDFTFAQEKGRRVRHLKEIRLSQVGMVMFPMNPDAQIMQVKHDFTALLETLTDEQKAELRALLGPAFPDPDQKAPPPVELATPAQMATLKAKLGQLHFGDHAYTARLASIGATDHGQPDSGDRRQA